MLIDLKVINGCLIDEIFTTFTVPNFVYEIGVTGAYNIAPTWAPGTVKGCPSGFFVFRLENGIQRILNSQEMGLITPTALGDGSINIENPTTTSVHG